MKHEILMREAIQLGELAAGLDEVPIGALVRRGELRLGEGYNRNIIDRDPTAHAEILALREACTFENNHRIPGATLYVTLEPCLMCFMAAVHARVKRIVFGARDPKNGYSLYVRPEDFAKLHHKLEVIPDVLGEECAVQIRAFFAEKRERGKRKWLSPTASGNGAD